MTQRMIDGLGGAAGMLLYAVFVFPGATLRICQRLVADIKSVINNRKART